MFREIGWEVAAWIVSIGAIFGLCARWVSLYSSFPLFAPENVFVSAHETHRAGQIFNENIVFGIISLMGAMLPLPRVIYAMASDGIIFRFLGKIHPRFQTPLLGTLLAGLLTGNHTIIKIVPLNLYYCNFVFNECVFLNKYLPFNKINTYHSASAIMQILVFQTDIINKL